MKVTLLVSGLLFLPDSVQSFLSPGVHRAAAMNLPGKTRLTSTSSGAIQPLRRSLQASSSVVKKPASRLMVNLLTATSTFGTSSIIKSLPILGTLVVAGLLAARLPGVIARGWRSYNKEENSVGREYDAWTREKILEHYWGEHIHLGYYTEEDQKAGYLKKNFIGAKYDFIDRMMAFAKLDGQTFKPAKVLDVGCGIGGTTRYIAKKLGTTSQVSGITLSQEQVRRAKELAEEQDVTNAEFQVMDALHMSYPDNSFDLVWACESGEHMPDKKAYVEEMVRVLKPGGTLVIACWCQRDAKAFPLSRLEQKRVDFMCTEWSHPYFISIQDFERLALDTGVMENVRTEDWAKFTLPSWRHSVWVGVFDPFFWMLRPHLWVKILRDAFTLNVFHNAFKDGLMGYGMIYAQKKK
ncbi:hypothetical protein NSK_008646 [Nannochloropsis salina CCMP1776]|uniref:Methyltransferase type 11 domain-containing protein n=1 Tax=Nannochloropsis salina CCMP1776 TaxID=1027361 RepID=A0A4D9CTP0_9STRA|nr:hypothetical protein NSK_008646 [Nannochloropsis salina CCMP1776]|eukprot:TFJ80089.1 hypothetical protein NSK_008646 [Nannochloropsis salina CCMP1776]